MNYREYMQALQTLIGLMYETCEGDGQGYFVLLHAMGHVTDSFAETYGRKRWRESGILRSAVPEIFDNEEALTVNV